TTTGQNDQKKRDGRKNETAKSSRKPRLIHLQYRRQQHIRSIHYVRGMRELLRRVTDSAHARYEYHPHRTELRHRLRVVTRTARHHLRAEPQLARRLAYRRPHTRVAGRRHVLVKRLVRERRPRRRADSLRLG